jgi:acetyl-CoA C-acetyltransferase
VARLDPRLPILVGAAQLEQRVDDPQRAEEPLARMRAALEAAAADAGSRALLRSAQLVGVIRGVWRYGDPARALAEQIGAPGARTLGTPYGGNLVQSAVNQLAARIQRGELDVAVLAGAENGHSAARARKAGVRVPYSAAPGTPDEQLAPDYPMNDPAELARGLERPVQLYPVFENALRRARGESLEAHLVRISELWARFNAAAVQNPHAWLREPLTAEQIRTPSAENRMVGFPYPKLMNSNSHVDQAAALLLTSVEAAERAGIPRERWLFVHAGTDAHDHLMVSHRANLHSSPAIRLAGARVLELAKTSTAAVRHLDLYSCFPVAVQVAAAELGIPESRQLTVTGGLTFGGGPLNNYVMHAIARMRDVLLADAGSLGLVTANGGYLTKHAFGIYSSEPPHHPYRHADVQAEVDALPRREAVQDASGPAELESYTVMFGADGPEVAHAACLLPDGRRTWANARDPDLLAAMTREEFGGRRVALDGAGSFDPR